MFKDRPGWIVQCCAPRDHFENCSLTVEQWLSTSDPADAHFPLDRAGKWRLLMYACALVYVGTESEDGLRQEPQVGYDPVQDQPVFIFKASNNGTTFLVSPVGVSLDSDEVPSSIPPPKFPPWASPPGFLSPFGVRPPRRPGK